MSKSSISILAKAISGKRSLTVAEAENFVTKMFEVAQQGLDEDKLVKMKWLGTFKVASVKDRESVDVNTGERILIEGRDKISFAPDNILKEIINKPFAQFETVVVNDGVDFADIDEKFSKMEQQAQPMVEEASHDSAPQSSPVVESETIYTPVSEANSVPVSGEKKVLVKDSEPELELDESLRDIWIPDKDESQDELSNHAKDESQDELSNHAKEESQDELPNEGNDEEQDSLVAVKEMCSEQIIEEEISEKQISDNRNPQELVREMSQNEANDETQDEFAEDAPARDGHHFVIPKYVVAIACLAFILLFVGMGWFAYSFGMMQAQRNQLADQLAGMEAKVNALKVEVAQPVPVVDSTEQALKEKAQQDSLRMAASSDAVKMAEDAEKQNEDKSEKKKDKAEVEVPVKQEPKMVANTQYDKDPRVRTGAYRIVGIDQVITVKEGQSLEAISKRYLGPGMECYVEALNGSQLKPGQKVKIPKLELKKKASAAK